MEWSIIWEPGLPLSPGTLGQDDKQQLLWGYPGILWGVLLTEGISKLFALFNKTRIFSKRDRTRIFKA